MVYPIGGGVNHTNYIPKFDANGSPIDTVAPVFEDSSGHVGIGTASPGAKLDVSASSGTTATTIADPNATLVDGAAWGQAFARIAEDVNNAGTGTGGSANQFGLDIQVNVTAATGSAANYEKAALLAYAQSEDPSYGSSTPNVRRDIVGANLRGIINTGSGNLGRAWGIDAQGTVNSGSDGYLIGVEIELFNNASTDQPNVDTTTSKYGLHVVNHGTSSTAAIKITHGSGDNPWHKGVHCDQGSIGTGSDDAFIQLKDGSGNNLFQVDRNGVISCSNQVSNVNPTNPNRTIKINIGGTDYYIHAKTTND